MSNYTVRIDANGVIYAGGSTIKISDMVTFNDNGFYDINNNLIINLGNLITVDNLSDSMLATPNQGVVQALGTKVDNIDNSLTVLDNKLVQGDGSGVNADLIDGYNIDADGIPLLKGYKADGTIAEYDGDLNTINYNSVYNTNSTCTNLPKVAWGFVTTQLHAAYNSTNNQQRIQSWSEMQGTDIYTRKSDTAGVWSSWVQTHNFKETISTAAPSGGVDGDEWYQV